MPKVVQFAVPEEIQGQPFEEDYLVAAQLVLKEQTILKLYKDKKISTGVAAKLLGMSIYDFIQFLSEYRVTVFDTSDESLTQEIESAQSAIP